MAATIEDGIQTLVDRFVPRFEVFVGKPQKSRAPLAFSVGLEGIADPTQATDEEKQRLDGNLFVARGNQASPAPQATQLIPLAGPWGEKADQHTDDILSVEFTESIDKQQLAKVSVELLNVYDPTRQFYRYTDVPTNLGPGQQGVFPLVDYGDTLALRFGYGSQIDWVFEGIVATIEVSFPADGESVVTMTAVDKRDRLRGQKQVDVTTVGADTDEEHVIAQIVKQAGLKVAAPVGQSTPSQSAANRRPADQDALQYVTDRANKASLELLCFGDRLFVYQPADEPQSAIRYVYRAGLTSFKPKFDGVGKPTEVRVVSKDPATGETVDVKVTTQGLKDLGLVPASATETASDTIANSGQGGDKTEVVTNYLAVSKKQAERLAAAILKRNLDAAFTVSGELIGDPRIRPRVTLKIEGVGRFSGFYYVTSVSHRLGPNGYQTSFNARRNSALGGT